MAWLVAAIVVKMLFDNPNASVTHVVQTLLNPNNRIAPKSVV
jgi:hypothetical protein